MTRQPWLRAPPEGTIVQVAGMRHLTGTYVVVQDRHATLDPLPGGIFALVMSGPTNQDLQVVTVPRSLTEHPRYDEWTWTMLFPFTVTDPTGDYMRLLKVPDYVECAVRAVAELSDTLPVVVDDGWLC